MELLTLIPVLLKVLPFAVIGVLYALWRLAAYNRDKAREEAANAKASYELGEEAREIKEQEGKDVEKVEGMDLDGVIGAMHGIDGAINALRGIVRDRSKG